MSLATNRPADDVEVDRSAFNAAFYELGLRWHWDPRTYGRLAEHDGDRARVRSYIESEQAHLLRAYDADFLADAILAAKQRRRQALVRCPAAAPPRFDWADARHGEVGV